MGFPALACGALALALPNQHLAAQEILGRAFGDGASPCGNGGTHSLDFPHQIGVFVYGKTLGRVFFGRKTPLREWGHGLPRLSSPNRCFWLRKNLGMCLGGHKKNLREARGLTPWFWGRPGLEPGASRMRRPCANPLGNLCTIPMEGP